MSAQTVLYVEDEENDAFFMRLAWKRAGASSILQVVRDGKEAIDYLAGTGSFSDRARHPFPSVVLLDLNLPLVSGFEVLAWIRRQPALETMPVAILSSSDQPHDIERAQALRANDFITKPSAPADLVEIVHRLCATWLTTPTGA